MKPPLPLFIVIAFLASCDPPSDLYTQAVIVLPVTVANPKDTINLGDSVCFVFNVPDTLTINGKTYRPTYENNLDGISVDFTDCKIDSFLTSGSRPNSPDCDTYADPGGTRGNLTLARVNGNKLYGRFYMIPKKIGVYYLWTQQAGYFSINNHSIRGGVLLNLEVPDKHHSLLLNMTRPEHKPSFQTFLQNSEDNKLPVYGFAVK